MTNQAPRMHTTARSTNAAGPVLLIVRDGWGRNPHAELDPYNAIKHAHTPRCDELLCRYPWTLIKTSGEDVGLPDGTMGNSEVGHQNIGAGRIVSQESARITQSIRSGEFFDNQVLIDAVGQAATNGRYVHLLGIASDAGVHGLLEHLYACIELCSRLKHKRVALHLFTDGRDTGPFTGIDFVRRIEARCGQIGVGRIVTVCGRYFAMDRDNRWERVQKAYACMTGRGEPVANFDAADAAVQAHYDRVASGSQSGDEFVPPSTIGGDWQQTRISDGDTVIFYNYRGDRPREITRAFVMDRFEGQVPPSPDSGVKGFDRGPKLDLCYVTMTAYEAALNAMVKVTFAKPPKMHDILGGYLADRGIRQFRCAETEKFPHVTFFFNDYREEPFAGEVRQMAQSPRVATYDLQPQMSASQVRDIVLGRLAADDCEDVFMVNFANADMVGHTGSFEATVKAAEAVDASVGAIVDAAVERGGRLIVTADHGNAELMYDTQADAPHTAHTTYDVECIIVDPDRRSDASGHAGAVSRALRTDGRLADVAPTMLAMMQIEKPEAMRGEALFVI